MPLPDLVAPSPDTRMVDSFEDREAQARLKLHLLMARLRTGLRTVMDPGYPATLPNWKDNLQDEMVRPFFPPRLNVDFHLSHRSKSLLTLASVQRMDSGFRSHTLSRISRT
jgi:hypothetical protein